MNTGNIGNNKNLKIHVRFCSIGKYFFMGILAMIFAACFSAWTGDEGTISVTIGGSRGRAVFDQEIILDLNHTIKLSSGSGVNQIQENIKAGQTVNFTVLPGHWDISVEAYLDEVLYAVGHDSVDVKPGRIAETRVQMIPAEYINAEAIVTTDSGTVAYESLSEAFDSVTSGTAIITLLRDITNQTPIAIQSDTKTITLVSQGDHTVTLGSAGSMFTVYSVATLKLGDTTSGKLTLKGISGNNSALITVMGGDLELNANTVIRGNENRSGNGGGVYVGSTGYFTMSGGTIAGNTTSGNGGGVYLDSGTFSMNGGTIYGSSTYESTSGLYNTAVHGASLYAAPGGTAMYTSPLVGTSIAIPLTNSGGLTYTDDTLPSTGDAAYPFKIYTETDLRMVGNTDEKSGWGLDKHYILMNDITLNNPVSPKTSNWTPIGAPLSGNEFTGVFDGNCKTITGLIINETLSANGQGMFGCITGDGASTGVVKNLGLINVSIIISGFPSSYIGGLSGYNLTGGTVSNCYVTGTVSGNSIVGGLVGNNSGTVSNCYTACEVSSQTENAGGIAGSNSGEVENCYATGNISGSANVAGVAGINQGIVKNCAAINPSITRTSGTMLSFGRITSASTGILGNNYARYDMLVNSSLSDTDPAAVQNNIHGGNITSANWNNKNWWASTASFPSSVWDIADSRLPILRGFAPGTQNPEVKSIPFTQPDTVWYGDGVSPTFTISTAAQLTGLAELVNNGIDSFSGKTITLTADINLSGYGVSCTDFNDGKGWIPIGYDYAHPFRGVFDGNGKNITGFYINDTTVTGYKGLFGIIGGGTVKNLGLMGVNINCAGSNIGGIAGQNKDGGAIENCFVTGRVNGTNPSSKNIGGLVGHNLDNMSRIESCYTTCAVSGNELIGGIAGWNENGTVQNCYATGNINGNTSIGGLVGYNDGSVLNCYASGSVSGSYNVGGIAGFCYNESVFVQNCAALNPGITASVSNIGRVVGLDFGATLTGNKARSDMKAITAEFDTGTHNEIGKGGMDIATDDTVAFSSVFSGWDSSAVWAFSSGDHLKPNCNLPTLRNAAVPAGLEPTLLPAL